MANLGKNNPSRLGQMAPPAGEETAPKLVKRSHRPQPKSFRFSNSDIERLQALVDRLGEDSGRRVKDVEVIRGLLVIGQKIDSKKLIDGIKESSF